MTDKVYPSLKPLAALLMKATATQIFKMVEEMVQHGPVRIIGYWNFVGDTEEMEGAIQEIFSTGEVHQKGLQTVLYQHEDSTAAKRRWTLIKETLDALEIPKNASEVTRTE